MESENKTLKLIDEFDAGDYAKGFKSQKLKLMEFLCPDLLKKAQLLREELKKPNCPDYVRQQVVSLNHTVDVLPQYIDMAFFASDNKFDRVINLSPTFMFASPIFRNAVYAYDEIYPTRFGNSPEAQAQTILRSFHYDESDVFAGRYLGYRFCDTFGLVDKHNDERCLVISTNTLGWPGPLEHSGFESWNDAYRHLSDQKCEVLAYMPSAYKPTKEQFNGQVMTVLEHFNPSVSTNCGIYLLTPFKEVVHAYKEDLDSIKNLRGNK